MTAVPYPSKDATLKVKLKINPHVVGAHPRYRRMVSEKIAQELLHTMKRQNKGEYFVDVIGSGATRA